MTIHTHITGIDEASLEPITRQRLGIDGKQYANTYINANLSSAEDIGEDYKRIIITNHLGGVMAETEALTPEDLTTLDLNLIIDTAVEDATREALIYCQAERFMDELTGIDRERRALAKYSFAGQY